MNIGELSQRLDITTVTLRHYEKIGLLKPKRSASGYRQYDQLLIRSDLLKMPSILALPNLVSKNSETYTVYGFSPYTKVR